MIRICFVCHGNICRSPMAEFIFKKLAADSGREGDFYVTSRATHTDEIWGGRGNPVYPPAKRQLELHGISSDGKRAQLLTAADSGSYDFFIGMDGENIRYMKRILKPESYGKIYKLMSFAGSEDDVSDPWYTRDFESAYDDIYRGCKALFSEVTK